MKTSARHGSALAAATALLALLPGAGAGGAPAHAADSRTIVGQGVYLCQSKPDGLPEEDYDVTLRISLNAPRALAPGQTVSLSGTATLQFPEKAYQEGKSIGVTEADGYSDSLSVGTTFNGKTTDVPANRWQTAPFPWSDPVVISAPITLRPFTVPPNATGSVTIRLPRNERRAPNTATKSPPTVAFNGVANNKTAVGNVPENLACYLQGAAPGIIGTLPISAGRAAGTTQTTSSSSGAGGAPAGTATSTGSNAGAGTSGASSPGTTPGSAGAAADAFAAPPGSSADPAAGAIGGSGTNPAAGSAAIDQGALSPTAAPRAGVFVDTSLLLLGGALVCILALGYAFLTHYRLRSLQRTFDDS